MTQHDHPYSHQFLRTFRTEHLHAPKNLPAITPTTSSLFLEIGAGKGKHAMLFATQNPNKHIIAVERTLEKFTAFDKLVSTQNLPNLTAVHADAVAFSVYHLKPESLDGVFILYPNPEPHNKNQRWLNMPFFEFLISRLKVGAFITVASNIEPYIDEARQTLDDVWRLPYELYDIEPTSARTHFEIKYLARQERCQEIKILKPNYYRTRFDEFDATFTPMQTANKDDVHGD